MTFDANVPLPVGSKISAYHVIESSPTRLVLKTSVLMMASMIVLSLLAVSFFSCALIPSGPRNVTVYDRGPFWELGGLLVSVLVLCICVSNLGRSLEFDAARKSVRMVRWFFFTTDVPAHAVRIEIRNQNHAEDKSSKQSSAPKPAGRDEAVLTLRKADGTELIEIARGTLGTGEWPLVATGAMQMAILCDSNIELQGQPQFADAEATLFFKQFAAAVQSK